ncbi:MAG: hypothetical protein SFY95_00235 [Planctomycetota bacterium]|nr:hypothetical protein [Planctomycetota bacterium]
MTDPTRPSPTDYARAAARRASFHAQRVAGSSDIAAIRIATWIILAILMLVFGLVLLPIAIIAVVIFALWLGLLFVIGLVRAMLIRAGALRDDDGRKNVRVKRPDGMA